VIVAAQYIGPTVLFGDVADVDIVVPRGHTLAQLTIGRWTPPSAARRVRIRGSTPSVNSGGLVGQITFLSNPTADIIIDGLDLNGADGKGGGALWHFARGAERIAVVNLRGHGVGPASLHSHSYRVDDLVIAGNRILSGARPREVNGYPEGWGIRGGDRIIVYDNRIDGTRYHRVRVHPKPGLPQYAWIANNTFVDPHEARIFGAFRIDSTPTFAAVWVVCNRVYAHSRCVAPSFEGEHAKHAMLTSNAFFGSITEEMQRAMQAKHAAGHDYLTGNTFAAWEQPPPWDGPGDPTEIPLPPLDPSRYNAALAFKPCPSP
jgi:hypothetical protein